MKNVLRNAIVIAMVSFLSVIAFTACSNSSNDNGGSSEVEEVAVYVSKYKSYSLFNNEETITFYSNNTYVRHYKSDNNGGTEFDSAKGTYTGKPDKDGKVNLSETHFLYTDKTFRKYPEPQEYVITITNGSFEFKDHTYTKQ